MCGSISTSTDRSTANTSAGAPASTTYSPSTTTLPGARTLRRTTDAPRPDQARSRASRRRRAGRRAPPATTRRASGRQTALSCGPASIVKNTAMPSRRKRRTAAMHSSVAPFQYSSAGSRRDRRRVHLEAAVLGHVASCVEIAPRDRVARDGEVARAGSRPRPDSRRRLGRTRPCRWPEPTAFSPAVRDRDDDLERPCVACASGSAKLSRPSARVPTCISTNPPKIERAAEPEPRRATMLCSRSPQTEAERRSGGSRRAPRTPKPTKQAPRQWENCSDSRSERASRCPPGRAAYRGKRSHARLSLIRSPVELEHVGSELAPNSTRICDQSPSSVIEIEPTAGVLSSASALPQYLTSAMLAQARAVPSLIASEPVLKPAHGGGNRLTRRAWIVTELALGLRAREIHVLGAPSAAHRASRAAPCPVNRAQSSHAYAIG